MLELILGNELTESNYDLVGGLSRDRENVDVQGFQRRANLGACPDWEERPHGFQTCGLEFFSRKDKWYSWLDETFALRRGRKSHGGVYFRLGIYVSATAELTEKPSGSN